MVYDDNLCKYLYYIQHTPILEDTVSIALHGTIVSYPSWIQSFISGLLDGATLGLFNTEANAYLEKRTIRRKHNVFFVISEGRIIDYTNFLVERIIRSHKLRVNKYTYEHNIQLFSFKRYGGGTLEVVSLQNANSRVTKSKHPYIVLDPLVAKNNWYPETIRYLNTIQQYHEATNGDNKLR